MTKEHTDKSEQQEEPRSGVVTSRDLKEAPKQEQPETVTLKSPQGTKVTTSADNAETLRDAGFT